MSQTVIRQLELDKDLVTQIEKFAKENKITFSEALQTLLVVGMDI